MIDVFRWSSQR